jgi:arabinose-5-phosphate isomerase
MQIASLASFLQNARQYLNYFFDHISIGEFETIVGKLASCSGVVYCSGVGKSGFIAKKIAATLTSTGTKAFFLSPLDALHGDLGALEPGDVWIGFSKSGSAEELLSMIPYLKKKGVFVIGAVSHRNSKLAMMSDLFIELPLEKELCPYNLAPTISSTIQLIFGDCLAMALMDLKKIQMEQFAVNHPAGLLGKKATLRVADIMITGANLPLCLPTDLLLEALPRLSEKKCGCLLVVNLEQKLLGIFTDGDFRRTIQKSREEGLKKTLGILMTPNPKTIGPEFLATQALEWMEKDPSSPVSVLPVLDQGRLIGLLRLHDIIQAGLIPKLTHFN